MDLKKKLEISDLMRIWISNTQAVRERSVGDEHDKNK